MRYLSVVSLAILFLVAGNLSASLSDVAVKLLNGGISPFQYMFIRQLFCVVLMLPFWLRTSPSQRQLGCYKIPLVRAHLVLAGSGFVMMALTYLPLATANAIFYAAPLLMLPLSFWILGEKPAATKVIATVIGFVGVLIVLRPSQFHWAALFALGCAFTLAMYNVLVKKLPSEQPVAITLFWTGVLSLPISGLLAFTFWQSISAMEIFWIAASAIFTLGYHGSAVAAYKRAHTSQIALAEYSGLIFVTLFGMMWFDEIPDGLTVVGILLIILPMMPIRWLKNKASKKPIDATN